MPGVGTADGQCVTDLVYHRYTIGYRSIRYIEIFPGRKIGGFSFLPGLMVPEALVPPAGTFLSPDKKVAKEPGIGAKTQCLRT